MVLGSSINVMIVDDSATARKILSDIVNKGPGMKVSSAVSDPYEAVAQLKRQAPDVMILDVQMPRMDGITFLKKLMTQHPLPVVMCSSFTEKGSAISLQCLEHGAIDIIAKPKAATKSVMDELETRIHDTIQSASFARMRSRSSGNLRPIRAASIPTPGKPQAKLSADEIVPPPSASSHSRIPATEKVIAVGASTGGTDALREFLMQMTPNCPGIVMVQHMPENFTYSFANRLNDVCPVRVREARNGDTVEPGLALLAPGSHHMLLKRSGSRYFVELVEGPLVSRHRPSVDVMFRSVASSAGRNAIGVILTGMGDDGATGMLEMKQAGSYNLAQDKESCVVFGMPNEAIKKGAAHDIVSLSRIGKKVLARV
ncbi:MAG: chemotaxis response regulator protein-glutamate methylesterase [Verrucomicrobiota bacterium]